jgi:hypothetical protein
MSSCVLACPWCFKRPFAAHFSVQGLVDVDSGSHDLVCLKASADGSSQPSVPLSSVMARLSLFYHLLP